MHHHHHYHHHVRGAGFCDCQLPVVSSIGRGPRGPQGPMGSSALNPKFADPIEWSSDNEYDEYTIVVYNGESYVSKMPVPSGTPISDEDHWVRISGYDPTIDLLRQALPLDSFDENNTVKDSIDEIRDGVGEARDDIGEVRDDIGEVRDDIDEIRDDISHINESASSTPYFLGAFAEPTAETMGHCGGIASNGTFEVVITSLGDNANMGKAVFVDINGNNSRYRATVSIEIGHGNSICYYPRNNVFIIAPEFKEVNGASQQWKQLIIYNPTFTSRTLINTPQNYSSIQSVSYDWKTGKLYALGIDNNLYEVNGSYQFTKIGEIDRAGIYNQDFAVYDGMYYSSSPSGFIKYGPVSTCEILGYINVNALSHNLIYCLGELNGMEFDNEGHLLATGDMSGIPGLRTYGYIYTIFQIPLKKSPVFYPSTDPEYVVTSISFEELTLNPNSNKLRGGILNHPNLAAIYKLKAGSTLELNVVSNFSGEKVSLSMFNSVVMRFSNSAVFECDVLNIPPLFNLMGSGTLYINTAFSTLFRVVRILIDTGVLLTTRTPGTDIFRLFVTGSRITVGSTLPTNVSSDTFDIDQTYSTYEFSRRTVYEIPS